MLNFFRCVIFRSPGVADLMRATAENYPNWSL
jgi:hypothetical protein